MTAMKVVLAIRQVAGGKELMLDTGEMLSGNSLTELAEENKEVAKLLRVEFYSKGLCQKELAELALEVRRQESAAHRQTYLLDAPEPSTIKL